MADEDAGDRHADRDGDRERARFAEIDQDNALQSAEPPNGGFQLPIQNSQTKPSHSAVT